MNTLLYLSFGSGPHVNELRFSVLSARRLLGAGGANCRVVIYTDAAAPFAGLDAEVVLVPAERRAEWEGPRRFFWRCKVRAVQDALARFGAPCVYVDGDTYFERSPEALFRRVSPGRTLMHVREGHLDKWQAKPIADFLATRPALVDLRGERWPVTEDTPMWNAGVVGIHPTDAGLVDEVLHLVDQLHAGSGHVHSEQFSFGAVLQLRTTLREAADVVQHYWAMERRAPFRVLLDAAFADGVDLARAEVLFTRLPAEPFKVWGRRRVKRAAEALGLHRDRRRSAM
jgi:hypothetical protein